MHFGARLIVTLSGLALCAACVSCSACKPIGSSLDEALLNLEVGDRICVGTPDEETYEGVFVQLSDGYLVCRSRTFDVDDIESLKRVQRDARTTWVMVGGTIGMILFVVLNPDFWPSQY